MPHQRLLSPSLAGGIRRVSSAKPVSSVGLVALDLDHQLVGIAIGILENEIAYARRGDALEKAVSFLIQFTDQHFIREERMMDQLEYPESAAHKASHDIMRAWMEASLPEIGSIRNPHYDDDVIAYLYDWWAMHGEKEDKGYADFIRHRLDEARRVVAAMPKSDLPGLYLGEEFMAL